MLISSGRGLPGQGGEHILVAEDETTVRDLIRQMLERLEYRVTLAANGNDALALVTEKGLDPDLVVTDIREFAARIEEALRPGERGLEGSRRPDGHQAAR